MNLFELFVKIGADTSQAEKGMKNTQKNSETLTNKIAVMSAKFESAQKNVDKLTKEFNESVSKTGAASDETQKLAKKLDDAEKEAEQAKKALDGYNSELVETEVKAEKAGGGLSNFASKLGKGLSTAAKIGTAAVGAASTAIVGLTKSAVENFAEYEQLVGGVDTLFKDASQKVQQYAAEAYKTAGMSANDYMENATAFSASLISSLGGDTEAAAEYANRAMVSMSDNANKMGTSIDSIVQTYQSLSRGNFAMLDNLKLGYGGTKAELERLIADAASYTEIQKEMGVTVDASSTSFDNIVNAIAVVQGKLGIAGATALEAGTTIEGSVNSMKAAWSNLVTGLADDEADFDVLMNNFVGSVKTVADNIAPKIGIALNGVGKLIKEIVPVAMQYIPQIIGEFLPTIGEAAIGIVTSIGTAIFDNIDQILEWGQQMLNTLLDGINNATGSQMSSAITNIITTFGSFILENLPEILMAGYNILVSLVYGIIDAIPQLATAAIQAIIQFASYITSPENVEKIETLGPDLVAALIYGIINFLDPFIDAGAKIVDSIKEGISEAWDGLVSWFNDLWDSLFKNKTVDVNVNASSNGGGGGSFANGLSYVPYDGFSAVLHEGERVLTAEENKAYNSGGANGNTSGITIIQNIQTVPQTPVEFAAATEAYFEQARWAFA